MTDFVLNPWDTLTLYNVIVNYITYVKEIFPQEGKLNLNQVMGRSRQVQVKDTLIAWQNHTQPQAGLIFIINFILWYFERWSLGSCHYLQVNAGANSKIVSTQNLLPLTGIISNSYHSCKGHDLGWVIWCIEDRCFRSDREQYRLTDIHDNIWWGLKTEYKG